MATLDELKEAHRRGLGEKLTGQVKADYDRALEMGVLEGDGAPTQAATPAPSGEQKPLSLVPQILEGLTAGFSDELLAKIPGVDYSAEELKAKREAEKAQLGPLATVGEIAGAFVPGLGTASGTSKLLQGAGRAKNFLGQVAGGTGLAAAYGAGQADTGERAVGAAKAAPLGLLGELAVPAVAAGAKGAYGQVAKRLFPEKAAGDMAEDLIMRQIPEFRGAVKTGRPEQAQMGVDAYLMRRSGEGFNPQGTVAEAMGPEGAPLLAQALSKSDQGLITGSNLAQDLTEQGLLRSRTTGQALQEFGEAVGGKTAAQKAAMVEEAGLLGKQVTEQNLASRAQLEQAAVEYAAETGKKTKIAIDNLVETSTGLSPAAARTKVKTMVDGMTPDVEAKYLAAAKTPTKVTQDLADVLNREAVQGVEGDAAKVAKAWEGLGARGEYSSPYTKFSDEVKFGAEVAEEAAGPVTKSVEVGAEVDSQSLDDILSSLKAKAARLADKNPGESAGLFQQAAAIQKALEGSPFGAARQAHFTKKSMEEAYEWGLSKALKDPAHLVEQRWAALSPAEKQAANAGLVESLADQLGSSTNFLTKSKTGRALNTLLGEEQAARLLEAPKLVEASRAAKQTMTKQLKGMLGEVETGPQARGRRLGELQLEAGPLETGAQAQARMKGLLAPTARATGVKKSQEGLLGAIKSGREAAASGGATGALGTSKLHVPRVYSLTAAQFSVISEGIGKVLEKEAPRAVVDAVAEKLLQQGSPKAAIEEMVKRGVSRAKADQTIKLITNTLAATAAPAGLLTTERK